MCIHIRSVLQKGHFKSISLFLPCLRVYQFEPPNIILLKEFLQCEQQNVTLIVPFTHQYIAIKTNKVDPIPKGSMPENR